MDPEDAAAHDVSWPAPHPSPPLPPPREYGSPGTPPNRHPWLWAMLAAVVIGALVSGGLVAVLRNVGGGEPVSRQPDRAVESSTPTDSPESPESPATPAPYRCWDGTPAPRLADCSRPSGEAGLRWVFPAIANQKCGASSAKGGEGVVVRVLCLHRLEDGTRVGVGYFQWRSVAAGSDFYKSQGLAKNEIVGPDGKTVQLGFSGVAGDQAKVAALFVRAPFSLTISYPATATFSEADQLALAPRPGDQLRGEPVG